ncbi:hypothetical protein K9M78_00780 [Candidatus Bipolaricaulota bacterium]|nr:hypothetical protein [Candidatus Bipolaricaulota bacterium]
MSKTEATENEPANDVRWIREHLWKNKPLLNILGDEELGQGTGLFKARMELKLRKKLFEMALLMYEDGHSREASFRESIESLSELGVLGFLVLKDELEEKLRPINSEEGIMNCLQEWGEK